MTLTTEEKRSQLLELAQKRKGMCRVGFRNVGDFHCGVYDCDHVSPWTKSASNVDANVMLVGQDWASEDRLEAPVDDDVAKLGHDPTLLTNKNLLCLLRRHFGLSFCDTYATNLFPYIKKGKLSAGIPMRDFVWAAETFLLPQIKIVSPKLAVCLGLKTFNSFRRAVGRKSQPNLTAAIADPITCGGTTVVAVAHTGALGMLNRGPQNVEKDWVALREWV